MSMQAFFNWSGIVYFPNNYPSIDLIYLRCFLSFFFSFLTKLTRKTACIAIFDNIWNREHKYASICFAYLGLSIFLKTTRTFTWYITVVSGPFSFFFFTELPRRAIYTSISNKISNRKHKYAGISFTDLRLSISLTTTRALTWYISVVSGPFFFFFFYWINEKSILYCNI